MKPAFFVRYTLVLCYSLLFVAPACKAPANEGTTGKSGTGADEMPDWMAPVETRADSVALAVFEACGGPVAWGKLQYIRFDFGVESPDNKRVFRHHLWNRFNGDYRVEWDQGEDTTVVVLMNVQSKEGKAWLNGVSVPEENQKQLVDRGYEAFINDTYWLLAPIKLLDPGVTRAYVADSSDATTDVITTTYENVGLTPEDQFWFWVDHASGKLLRWAYQLQGEKDKPPTSFMWGEYETYQTPGGVLRVMPRKSGTTRDLMTDQVAMPTEVDPTMFTNPQPML